MLSDNLLLDLEQKGIVHVKNFFDSTELEKARKIVKNYSVKKGHKLSYFSTNLKLLSYKLLKFNFRRFSYIFIIYQIFRQGAFRSREISFRNKDDITTLCKKDGIPEAISELLIRMHAQTYRGDDVDPLMVDDAIRILEQFAKGADAKSSEIVKSS